MRFRSSLSIVLVLIAMAAPVPAQEWPSFHNDVALSGFTSSRAPDTNALLWKYQTGYAVEASPVVAGGNVYVGNLAGRFFCLDQYTGSVIWMRSNLGAIKGTAAVWQGKVFVLSTTGRFHVFDAEDGTDVRPPVDFGRGPWDWASPAVHGGNVFIASSLGWMYCFEAATGAERWRSFVGGSPDSPISVAGGMVFTGTHNMPSMPRDLPTLVALDEATGALLWRYDYIASHPNLMGMVNSNGATVVDADGDGDLEVFVGIYIWQLSYVYPPPPRHGIVALDAATGAELWGAAIGNSTSTPAVKNGRVFVGGAGRAASNMPGNFFALDAATGARIWSYETGAEVWAAPVISGDGKVCVGSLDHTFYCFSWDGALVWSYFTGQSRLKSSPALSNGVIYVGNENGHVYAFGPKPVKVDIHPTSCPNPLNVGQKGVVPVAIVGDGSVDLSTVDLTSLRLEGVAPLRSALEDVTAPVTVIAECACTTEGPDGVADLTLKFDALAVGAAAGKNDDGSYVRMRLTGKLLDGTPIEGSDCVRYQIKAK